MIVRVRVYFCCTLVLFGISAAFAPSNTRRLKLPPTLRAKEVQAAETQEKNPIGEAKLELQSMKNLTLRFENEWEEKHRKKMQPTLDDMLIDEVDNEYAIKSFGQDVASDLGQFFKGMDETTKSKVWKRPAQGGMADKVLPGVGHAFDALAQILDIFETGDIVLALAGCVSVIGNLSFFASFGGPPGIIAAAVIGPVCALVSSLLVKSKGPVETESAMIIRVIKEVIDEKFDEELQSLAAGELKVMNMHLKILESFITSSETTELSPVSLNIISGSEFLLDGANFMERLWYLIEKSLSSPTIKDAEAERTAKHVYLYASIARTRAVEQVLLCLLYERVKAPAAALCARNFLKELLNDTSTKLEAFAEPDEKNLESARSEIYCSIQCLPIQELRVIEEFVTFKGGLISIKCTKQPQNSRLMSETMDGKQKARIINKASSNRDDQRARFRIFPRDKDKYFDIFACFSGGYVYPDTETSRIYDDGAEKHYVYAYKRKRANPGWSIGSTNDGKWLCGYGSKDRMCIRKKDFIGTINAKGDPFSIEPLPLLKPSRKLNGTMVELLHRDWLSLS